MLGYPALRVQHHYLAFVTLAFSTLAFLVFRNESWLTGGIYGISNIPRPRIFGYRDQQAAADSTISASASWRSCRCGVVADPLALGPRLHGIARKSAARAVARRRHKALYADGVRDRLGARRRRRRALCAADAIHRPVPFNLSLSLDLLMMVIVGGAGYFFGPFLGAIIAVLLPEWLRFTEGYYLIALRGRGDAAVDLVADRHSGILERYCRAPHQGGLRAARRGKVPAGDGAMSAVLEVTASRRISAASARSTASHSTSARARSSA